MQELEDSYGVKMSDEEAARIRTVGQAVDFVLAHDAPAPRGPDRLNAARTTCWTRCRTDLARQAVTHASWTERRADSYERLAFLGDSRARRWRSPRTCSRGWRPSAYGAGRLTKIRAQAVSGRSCRDVAERLGLPERLRAAAPAGRAGDGRERAGRAPSACWPR